MVTTTPPQLLEALTGARLLAIIRGTSREHAVRAALTLLEEGVRCLEVSLTTDRAVSVIEAVVRGAPPGSVVGAGTVLARDQVAAAVDAGAGYVVTPALAASVPEAAARGVPVLAGALTPTEAVTAMGQGATAVKLFPASFGGPAYLKALREPLPHVPFVPVGGIDADGAPAYLGAGAVAVGVGSPLLGDAAAGGDLEALRARARDFLAAVRPAAHGPGS